jgi:fatty acid/phospholipid biosynthesis enzyme
LSDDKKDEIKEYEADKEKNFEPTQYYSNLTVPGGINYTENEIATPAITPSIKGHAQFATPNGIGWFRSDEKGNEVTKEAFKLLEGIPNFIGNVEGNDIFNGSVDVVVCDGFIGNIMLKTAEGVADTIGKIIKQNLRRSLVSILGAVLMRKVFKGLKLKVDYAEYGGAPLLGVKAPVIIAHGKSNAKAMQNAIFQAVVAAQSDLNINIESNLNKYKD